MKSYRGILLLLLSCFGCSCLPETLTEAGVSAVVILSGFVLTFMVRDANIEAIEEMRKFQENRAKEISELKIKNKIE